MPARAASSEVRPPELDQVAVQYEGHKRFVTCFCGEKVAASIVPHLKTKHAERWQEYIAMFLELRADGYPLKRIMREFRAGDGQLLFSWTVVERAIRTQVESKQVEYQPPRKGAVTSWEPSGLKAPRTTVWDFPHRGDWAVHTSDYRGNWPPQVPRYLIERYTKEGDLVVDSFMGGGTTLIEAWLLKRRSIGFDISQVALQTAAFRLDEMEQLAQNDARVILAPEFRPTIVEGSALQLRQLLEARNGGFAQLICAHPPYLDSLAYTTSHAEDLARIGDPGPFCEKMRLFAQEARAVLAPGGTCAVLVGDVRRNHRTIPLGFRTLDSFLSAGFELESVVIKTQHSDRSTEFYAGKRGNDFLLSHEYLLLLRRGSL